MNITFFDTLILSLVQGITEFLPISSSGHLVLAPALFNFTDPGLSFSVALHIGTLGAVIVYFWHDIYGIVKNIFWYKGEHNTLPKYSAIFLTIATIPAAIAGFFLEDIVSGILRTPIIVVALIVVMNIILWIVDRFFSQSNRTIATLTLYDALWFGILQAVAIVPGVSRSGATIIAGRALGFTRHSATRFSFLMAIPVILGATILELPDAIEHGLTSMILIGIVVSFIAAYVTIALFLRFIERVSFIWFIWYSILLFGAVIAFS